MDTCIVLQNDIITLKLHLKICYEVRSSDYRRHLYSNHQKTYPDEHLARGQGKRNAHE